MTVSVLLDKVLRDCFMQLVNRLIFNEFLFAEEVKEMEKGKKSIQEPTNDVRMAGRPSCQF